MYKSKKKEDEISKPSSLFEYSIKQIVKYPNLLLIKNNLNERVKYKIRDNIGPFSERVTNLLIDEYRFYFANQINNLNEFYYKYNTQNEIISYYDYLMGFVSSPAQCKITKIVYHKQIFKSLTNIQKLHLDDHDFKFILDNHNKITYLDLCPYELTAQSLIHLNNSNLSKSLKCLFLRKNKYCHDIEINTAKMKIENDFYILELMNLSNYPKSEFIFYNLHYLSFRNLDLIDFEILRIIIKNIKSLKYLDMSNCCTNKFLSGKKEPTFKCLDFLLNHKQSLTYLSIAFTLKPNEVEQNLKYILQLKNLNHLNISNYRNSRFNIPSLILAKLVYHLRNLNSLDISGTNLTHSLNKNELDIKQDAVEFIKQHLYDDLDEYDENELKQLNCFKPINSGLEGLNFINNKKKCLDFLGCFECKLKVYGHIPVLKIGSENNMNTLLSILEANLGIQSDYMQNILYYMVFCYKNKLVEQNYNKNASDLIMSVLEQNLNILTIQLYGIECFRYIIEFRDLDLTSNFKYNLISILINSMDIYTDHDILVDNCLKIMFHFIQINEFNDVKNKRLIQILIYLINKYMNKRENNEDLINSNQKLSVTVLILNFLIENLNNLVEFKDEILTLFINLIKMKIKYQEYDSIFEKMLTILNCFYCKSFEMCEFMLNKELNSLFELIDYLNVIDVKANKIYGLFEILANIAGFKQLRNRLYKKEYIFILKKYLYSKETAFYCSFILVLIISDCQEGMIALSIDEKQSIINYIKMLINSWISTRNIWFNRSNSYIPFLKQILNENFDEPICNLWSNLVLNNFKQNN